MQLRPRLVRPHERGADEDGIGAGELGRGRLRACVDRALGDDDTVPRSLGDERELSIAVDPERPQVARVDADHASFEPCCALELLLVVGLHQRVESELFRYAHQP